MTLSIDIPDFDRLSGKTRMLFWHWAESGPAGQDRWSVLLRDILSGLRVGRLRVAAGDESWRNIAVPPQASPRMLPPAFLIGLSIAVTEAAIWKGRDPWIEGAAVAQALGARLTTDSPHAADPDFAAHFQEIAYFAAGGRELHWLDRMFE